MESYYLSESWKLKRQERLEFDSHTCQGCGITAKQLASLGWPGLQVHHKNSGPPDYRYPSFGNENLNDLLTLCASCHDGITNSVRKQRYLLDPLKEVPCVSIDLPSTQVPLGPARHEFTQQGSNLYLRREPVNLPQRSNSRSEKYLRQSS